jgi:alpha-beta hydrolase superfamily lysophospholipase
MRPATVAPLLAALALGGCSYAPYAPLRLPEHPAASSADVDRHEGFFEGARGTKLYEQVWAPRGEPRAIVVLVHGLKDHSARYAPLAERLVKQGFLVGAFDLRGHGRSEGLRVWVQSFDDHLGDVDLFLKRMRDQHPGKPVLLFGHSMGGAIATLYTITRKPALAGLVLSGAALATDVSGATIGGTKVVAALSPVAGVFNLDLHQFSRDPAVVAEGLADPLVYQGGAAARTAAELLGAIGQIQERMGEVDVPLLALHGEADTVTPPAGSRALVERAAARDKTLKLYPGLYHDLLHEPEKEQVMADVVKWMGEHAPPVAPPKVVAPAPKPAAPGSVVADIVKDARGYEPLVKGELARQYLASAADLPPQAPRTLWHDAEKTRYFTEAQRAQLPEAERAALKQRIVDEELFYTARWGTPAAYARPLEVLGGGKDALVGKKVLDFGFGAIGQERMLASLGANVTGIDVDPLGAALYTWPGDQGAIPGRLGKDGALRLLFGRFPAEPAVRDAAGKGYDLFLSKNVLKRGYIHPERPAEEKHLIKLGVDDETFVRTLHGMVVPGGRVLIYNLAPAQAPADKPYIPWADGRCPFAKELWQKVGFKVVAYDQDDTAAARAMGHAFGWDQGEDRMDLEKDLFATYTLVERPR